MCAALTWFHAPDPWICGCVDHAHRLLRAAAGDHTHLRVRGACRCGRGRTAGPRRVRDMRTDKDREAATSSADAAATNGWSVRCIQRFAQQGCAARRRPCRRPQCGYPSPHPVVRVGCVGVRLMGDAVEVRRLRVNAVANRAHLLAIDRRTAMGLALVRVLLVWFVL